MLRLGNPASWQDAEDREDLNKGWQRMPCSFGLVTARALHSSFLALKLFAALSPEMRPAILC